MKTKTTSWFDYCDFPEGCPDDCMYLITTPDAFGTGDSPTEYDCSCRDGERCPQLDDEQ